MGNESELKFPTFECIISNTIEPYDSEMEMFFLQKNYLAAELSRLRLADREWAGNYEKMITYIRDLTGSIIDKSEPPSHKFLMELSMGEEVENGSTEDRLLRSSNPLVADLAVASYRTRELMFWYVRNSRDEKLAKSFTPQRFQGLPFLRLALAYRGIYHANSKSE